MIKIFKNYQNYFKAIKEDFNTDYLGTLLPEVMYRISKYVINGKGWLGIREASYKRMSRPESVCAEQPS